MCVCPTPPSVCFQSPLFIYTITGGGGMENVYTDRLLVETKAGRISVCISSVYDNMRKCLDTMPMVYCMVFINSSKC
jgi:hypothetical protein